MSSNDASISPGLVRGVISTSLSDAELESSIATAITLYNNTIAKRVSNPKELQVEIKRYLAAHFVAIKDPSSSPTKEKIGDASVEYNTDSPPRGGGFLSTIWGRTAAALDVTGSLLGGVTAPPRMVSL